MEQIPLYPHPSHVVGVMTPSEYHAFLRTANDRYEFIDGNVIRMPSNNARHCRISTNLLCTLGNLLEEAGSSCDILGSGQKIYTSRSRFYLPDAIVYCGEAQSDDEDCLRNPVLIAEILSPSTSSFDQGDKFRDYRRIESLTHYVLIQQDAPSVTHYEKGENGLWAIVGDYTELTDSLPLTLGGAALSIPLARLYRRVPVSAVS